MMPKLAQASTTGMVEVPSDQRLVSRISAHVDPGAAAKGFQIRTCNVPVNAYAMTSRKPTQATVLARGCQAARLMFISLGYLPKPVNA